MSKLHFYRKIGKHLTWCADGDGNVSQTTEFSVTITSGSVQRDYVYEIRQGQSPAGDRYDCLASASRGGRGVRSACCLAGVKQDRHH
jgi:hypothetical protein